MIRAGVLGHPIAQSLSPRIYSAWMEELGLEGAYAAFDVPPSEFADFVLELMDQGYRGVNVTLPHKSAALCLADEASDAARAVGASNLLLFDDERIFADNTDAYGFERSLQDVGASLTDRHAVVLGAGGAAAAILYALRGFEQVTLLNRTRARAEDLGARFLNVATEEWERRSELIGNGPSLLVNTTSLGMAGQPPLDVQFGSHPPQTVVDIVYKPLMTDLLRRAALAGSRTQHGLSMLVHQAVPSFEAYTGQKAPDPDHILRILAAEFS